MRVVIASSISGGHLFPAIAVAQELRKLDQRCQILLVSGKRKVSMRILENEDFSFILLPPFPRFNILRLILVFIRFSQNLILSFNILKRAKPKVAVGFGGFLSAPVLLCACLFRIPTIIHEQNLVPGQTNLILAKFVDAVAISFEESAHFFKQKEKLIFTGNPIRSSLRKINKNDAAKKFGFKPENFTLFVMGGSQGAHSINKAVVEAIERLNPEECQCFQIIHITGEADYNIVQDRYKKLKLDFKAYSFMNDIDVAYAASDLIISRAGASAISEIDFLGKTAIFIPYPYARSHQLSNARYMTERNKAVLLEEHVDLSEQLYKKILNFYKNRDLIYTFSKPSKSESNATKGMVELIVNLKSDEKT